MKIDKDIDRDKTVTFLAVKRLRLRSRFYKVVQLHITGRWVNYIHFFVNFQYCVSAKNYENRLICVEVMSDDKVGFFETVVFLIVFKLLIEGLVQEQHNSGNLDFEKMQK